MRRSNAKLVLIGWHGADWKAIHPLVDAGLMPNLASLLERGVGGNLKPSGPGISAILWTSIATGKSADQHGILSALEPDPLSGGTRPVGNTSRRIKALWNIAVQSGLQTHAIGWAASHPAEKLNGCCVAPRFVQPLAPYDAPWPVLPGSVHPARLTPPLAQLRVHAGELTAQDLRPFIPLLGEINQESDRRVIAFADTLAQAISIHAIATWLLEHEPWDLMMIGWTALQRACHLFMRYAAPPLPGLHPDDAARYGDVVTGMYCYHDLLLGRIMQLAGTEATIAIVSAAGFRSGDERPVSEALQAQAAAWYRPYGMFCMAGPHIAADQLIHNVTMFDVAPTMLGVLGLPPGADMPGRVIAEAFSTAPAGEQRIPSWDDLPGECGMQAPETAEDRTCAAAALAELAALGYVDDHSAESAARIHRESLYNIALIHLGSNRYAAARTALLELHAEAPDPNLSLLLAYCHFRCGDFPACAAALKNAPTEGLAAAHAKILESHLETAQGNALKAVSAIAAAERLGSDRPIVNWIAGWMYVRHGRLSRAEDALRQALALDPSFEQAHALLARVLTMRGKGAEAAETALHGLSVDYASASLHSALGIALVQSDDIDGALQAFETSLAFDPQLQEAALWAAELTSRRRKSA